jgi:hypothetical protein
MVDRTNTVTVWDSTGFLAPVTSLNNALDSLINDLIKHKKQVEAINYVPTVRSQLLKLKDATDALTKACFSKLPFAAATLARPVSTLINSKLEKAVNAFPLPTLGSGSWWPSTGPSLGTSPRPPQPQSPSPFQQGPSPYQQGPSPYQQGPSPYQQGPSPYQGTSPNGWKTKEVDDRES